MAFLYRLSILVQPKIWHIRTLVNIIHSNIKLNEGNESRVMFQCIDEVHSSCRRHGGGHNNKAQVLEAILNFANSSSLSSTKVLGIGTGFLLH